MKSSYFVNFGLIILLSGLYWLNNHNAEQSDLSTRLTTIDSLTIKHIVISQANRAEIVLDKIADRWQLTSPLAAYANTVRVNLLLSLLTIGTDRKQAVTKGQDLSVFGLTNNSAQLILGQKRFIFGNLDPISKQRYVLHDDVIYMLEDRFSPLLNAHASSFIDNRLIPTHKKIIAIELPLRQKNQLIKETIVLKLINGRWETKHAISMDKRVELLDNWRYASALQIIPLDAIASKFKPTAFRAKVTLDNQSSMTLGLHLKDSGLYIINEKDKLVYQFPKPVYQTLLLSTQDQ